jgi:hypothetical protein
MNTFNDLSINFQPWRMTALTNFRCSVSIYTEPLVVQNIRTLFCFKVGVSRTITFPSPMLQSSLICGTSSNSARFTYAGLAPIPNFVTVTTTAITVSSSSQAGNYRIEV